MTGTKPVVLHLRNCVGTNKKAYQETLNHITIGGCTQMKQVVDVVESCKKEVNILLVPLDQKNRLINLMYQDANTEIRV